MRIKHLLYLISVNISLYAQFTEDFSDGNFSSTPTWSGDESKFTIVGEELRSNSTKASDIFYLSTPSALAPGDLEWRFRVNMQFSTSGANYTDVYLMADTASLTQVTNGYFVRIGNTKDEISLYKIVGGTTTQLTDGTDSKTHNKNITVRVTKGAFGTWAVYADYTGGNDYATEGTAIDNDITTSDYFGFYVKQSTPKFHLKHFYDDIYVGPLEVDTQKPSITHTEALDANTIRITASEPISIAGTSFDLNNGYGNPDNALANGNQVTLTYYTSLTNNTYELTINALGDLAGNRLDTTVQLSYFVLPKPNTGDILITEIFADPTPSIGLPDAEFLEIYNTTNQTLDLTGCTISDGGSSASLPTLQLAANSYAVLVKDGTQDLFASYPNVIAVPSFPSLNNTGDALELKNENDILLDAVAYTDDFYRDVIKKAGGYSLERIDFESSCPTEVNWIASNDANSGTPSRENSVLGQNPDNTAPQLLSAVITSDNTVELQLSEKPTGVSDLTSVNYSLLPNNEQPTTVILDNATNTITLTFASILAENSIYELEISQLGDCIGNTITALAIQIIRTSPLAANDVIINEILFNPKENGVDFIELYSISKKYIALDFLFFQYVKSDGKRANNKVLVNRIIGPEEYVALTADSNQLKIDYPNATNLLEVENLPPMNNDEGAFAVFNALGMTLDSVAYTEDQHFALLSDVNGVSLERIDPFTSSTTLSNWHSASSMAGYATPGYQNSQYKAIPSASNTLNLASKTVSPDGDGYEDVLTVVYDFSTNGHILNGYVYDLSGRLIDHAFNNLSLSTSSTINWDGMLENGTKIPVGNYILLLETFDLEGNITRKKFAFSILGLF